MGFWISYGMNVAFGSCRAGTFQPKRRMNFKQPARTVAFMDAHAYGNAIGEVGWQSCLSACDAHRHSDYAQVLFLDQHTSRTLQSTHNCNAERIDSAFWGCSWLKP